MEFFDFLMGQNSSENVSVQADYSQNDPSAKDYIKNRPFYTNYLQGEDLKIIIPKTQITLNYTLPGFDKVLRGILEIEESIWQESFVLENTEYVLKIDDIPYDITITYVPERGYCFGNLSYFGLEYNGQEKFCGVISYENVVVALETDSSLHTISLLYKDYYVPIVHYPELSFTDDGDDTISPPDNTTWAVIEANFYLSTLESYTVQIGQQIYSDLYPFTPTDETGYILGNYNFTGKEELGSGQEFRIIVVDNKFALIQTILPPNNYTFKILKSITSKEKVYKLDSKYLDLPYSIIDDTIAFNQPIIANNLVMANALEDNIKSLDGKINNTSAEIRAEIKQTQDLFNNLPRPLIEGKVIQNTQPQTSGLSAGSGEPTGILAWCEGSANSCINLNTYGFGKLIYERVVVDKVTTDRWYLQYNYSYTQEGLTFEEYSAMFSLIEYFVVQLELNGNYYWVKKESTNFDVANQTIQIYFSFLPEDTNRLPLDTTIATRTLYNSIGYYGLGNYSHSEGQSTAAIGQSQHAQGKYNIIDTENKYAHIVGNGQNEFMRSNAHTLDWEGNAWYAGVLSASDIIINNTSGNVIESLLDTINNLQVRIKALEDAQIVTE